MTVAMVFGIVGCNNNGSDDDVQATTYTVTFDVQGHGTAPKAQTVNKGGHATEPTAPVETGWIFEGWYKESGCVNEYSFTGEAVIADITLYAKWTEVASVADSYTVTFDVQGHGTAPKAQTVNKGGHAEEPTAPAEAGWDFGGWYKESGCVNGYNFATETVTSDITVYAKWTENSSDKTPTTNAKPTIYLAGDSTVKTYNDAQYIGGWGQYLNYFLSNDVTVVNAANGGRSSRSFINEGRLYNIKNNTYSFSENNRKSIEDVIKAGDFLFIQFGHNDDDTNKGTYSTLYDRMVPLGTPDSNGVFPVTAPSDTAKMANTYLPQEYIDHNSQENVTKAYSTIKTYGDTYFSYDCGGTYKWYLKQYVDFARSKDAIPVLVTPVARVAFNSDGTLRGGAGRHGDNFAYVQAVRQLAQEEDCLLIDNFAYTKNLIETATKSYADFLMALVPNDLTGTWPTDYDNGYNNADAGFQKIEATHYNKYGAYLTAGYVANSILASATDKEIHRNGGEYFNFTDYVKEIPSAYVDPSNRISRTKVAELEGLYTIVNPTNPNRTYPDPAEVVAKINEVCKGTVTAENYLQYQEKCGEALALYNGLNYDDRSAVTNYGTLKQYIAEVEKQIAANRPVATRTVVLDASDLAVADITSAVTSGDFKLVGAEGKAISVKATQSSFDVNGEKITVSKGISMGGSASFTGSRYIEFTTTGACTVTVVAKSSGNDDRTLNLVSADATNKVITTFGAETGVTVTSQDLSSAGTYRVGSAGSGIWIYYILIEYFD